MLSNFRGLRLSRPKKKGYTPRKNRPQSAHFCQILNWHAGRENDPIWEIMSERMLSISVIKSVGYLTFNVRGQVDRKKRDNTPRKITLRERISAEF